MNVHPAIFQHPKFIQLKRQVGIGAMHYLTKIWAFCQLDQRGQRLGKVSAEFIECLAEFDGEPGKLHAILVDTGWLDVDKRGQVCVHDWNEYNIQLVKNWENGKFGRLGGLAKNSRQANGKPEGSQRPPSGPPFGNPAGSHSPASGPPKPPPLDRIGLDRSSTKEHTNAGEVGIPTNAEEVVEWGKKDGVPEEVCREFFDFNASLGWMMGNTRIRQPRLLLQRFWEKGRRVGLRRRILSSSASVFEKKTRIENLEKLVTDSPANPQSNCARRPTDLDRKKYQFWCREIDKLRREIAEGVK